MKRDAVVRILHHRAFSPEWLGQRPGKAECDAFNAWKAAFRRYRIEQRRREREACDRNKHPCAASNCIRRCQRQHLMCWIHWCQVPRALQSRIYATCQAGMGPDYHAAVKEAVERIAQREMAKAGLVLSPVQG